VTNATVLIWRVLRVAEHTFRRMDGYELVEKVAQRVSFVDGREVSHRTAIRSFAAREPTDGRFVAAGPPVSVG
jgi:hypothetical protein